MFSPPSSTTLSHSTDRKGNCLASSLRSSSQVPPNLHLRCLNIPSWVYFLPIAIRRFQTKRQSPGSLFPYRCIRQVFSHIPAVSVCIPRASSPSYLPCCVNICQTRVKIRVWNICRTCKVPTSLHSVGKNTHISLNVAASSVLISSSRRRLVSRSGVFVLQIQIKIVIHQI